MQPQKKTFEEGSCKGEILYHNRDELTVRGQITGTVKGGRIQYRAANPMDRRMSFSGSGLPYASYQQAFDHTPNAGEKELTLSNAFEINLLMPNSYYIGLGSVLVEPTLFIEYYDNEDKKVCPIIVNNATPFRTLTYPISNKYASRQNPEFYAGMWDLPIRTQEQILKDSTYPETQNDKPIHVPMPSNFWGMKPPV